MNMAEREGFEPSLRYKRKHDFESCAFNHSATSPDLLAPERQLWPPAALRTAVRAPRGCAQPLSDLFLTGLPASVIKRPFEISEDRVFIYPGAERGRILTAPARFDECCRGHAGR